MVYLLLFAVVATIEMIFALMIFLAREILHAVIALSLVFICVSLLFLMLAEPMLALLQLFLMVGGVSTYAFVGVAASSYSKFKHMDFIAFICLVAVLLGVMYLAASGLSVAGSYQQNVVGQPNISELLGPDVGLLYITTAMLFGTGLGSIILMRKLGGRK